MLAASPIQIVLTSARMLCIVSYIAIPAVITPPGLFIYNIISFSGFSESNNNNSATTTFANSSSISSPKNIILSLNNLEKISNDLSPREEDSITIGT